jgi:hypothetical protein
MLSSPTRDENRSHIHDHRVSSSFRVLYGHHAYHASHACGHHVCHVSCDRLCDDGRRASYDRHAVVLWEPDVKQITLSPILSAHLFVVIMMFIVLLVIIVLVVLLVVIMFLVIIMVIVVVVITGADKNDGHHQQEQDHGGDARLGRYGQS